MLRTCTALAAWFGIFTTVAQGHPGPRIWVDVLNGKVVTFAGPYPPGDPANYHLSTVFTQSLIDEGEDIWDTDLPGYQRVPGGHIPSGTIFRYNIAGPLLWYDPGDAVHCPFFVPVSLHFSGSPAVPQVAVTNELLQTQYTANGFVSGDAAFAYTGSAGDHNHLTYTLLGDGANPGGGPDGVYALPLQLTAGGYTASDTFYLLLGKNALASDLSMAAEVVLSPRVAPDLDCDGDVDGTDLVRFSTCRTLPGLPISISLPGHEECHRADFDLDGDVDQDDFGIWQRCFSGVAPAYASCTH